MVGNLIFAHKGQESINPAFAEILKVVSEALGRPLNVQSGYRSPGHRAERRKARPGMHSHGKAVDFNLAGWDEAERAALIRQLHGQGVKRFITYTNSPNLLHVDLKDQTGKGTPWFMHDKTNRLLHRAPQYYQALARELGGQASPAVVQRSAPAPAQRPAQMSMNSGPHPGLQKYNQPRMNMREGPIPGNLPYTGPKGGSAPAAAPTNMIANSAGGGSFGGALANLFSGIAAAAGGGAAGGQQDPLDPGDGQQMAMGAANLNEKARGLKSAFLPDIDRILGFGKIGA